MKILSQRRPRPVIPIISLIDILAILLIFFIVTMTFDDKSVLKIEVPTTEAIGTQAPRDTRVILGVDKEGAIFLDDQPVEEGALADLLTELRAAQPEAKLELKADTEAPLGSLVNVWDALTVSGYEIKDVPARIQMGAEKPAPGEED